MDRRNGMSHSETGRKFKWNIESYSIGLSVRHGMTKKQVEDEEEEVEEDNGRSTGWWKIICKRKNDKAPHSIQ